MTRPWWLVRGDELVDIAEIETWLTSLFFPPPRPRGI